MAEITYTDVHVTKASTLSESSDHKREVKVRVISKPMNGQLTMNILEDFMRGMEMAGARAGIGIEIRTYESGSQCKPGWLVAEWIVDVDRA